MMIQQSSSSSWFRTTVLFMTTLVVVSTTAIKQKQNPNPNPNPRYNNNNNNNNRNRNLIINGQIVTDKGRYPYFSTLHHECGGALIAPDTIITAGHCLPSNLHSVLPHVGTFAFDNNSDDGTSSHNDDDNIGPDDDHNYYHIVHMIRHKNWKKLGDDEFRHDMALLFIDRPQPLQQNGKHVYIKINRDPNFPSKQGEPLTAMGVGWTSNDYKHAKKANILHDVQLEYLPNDQCELSSDAVTTDDDDDDDDDNDNDTIITTTYEGRIHPDHLCTTGGPNNSRDSCAYDSGSPIISKKKGGGDNGNEEDVLVALVSWGEGCADPNFPAVNTRITDGLDFITESICQYSKYPPKEFCCNNNDSDSDNDDDCKNNGNYYYEEEEKETQQQQQHGSNNFFLEIICALLLFIIVIIIALFLIIKRIITKSCTTTQQQQQQPWMRSYGGNITSWSPQKHWLSLRKQFSTTTTTSETEYLLYSPSSASSIGSTEESSQRESESGGGGDGGDSNNGHDVVVSYDAV